MAGFPRRQHGGTHIDLGREREACANLIARACSQPAGY
jgi:hypothetical protein